MSLFSNYAERNILFGKCPQKYPYKMQRHTYVKINISVSRGYKNEILCLLLCCTFQVAFKCKPNATTVHLIWVLSPGKQDSPCHSSAVIGGGAHSSKFHDQRSGFLLRLYTLYCHHEKRLVKLPFLGLLVLKIGLPLFHKRSHAFLTVILQKK